MSAADLSWDEAMALAAKDRERLAVKLRGDALSRGPRYHRTVQRDGWLRYSWRIVDEAVSPHPVLASGRALTERGGWRRVERAQRQLGGAR